MATTTATATATEVQPPPQPQMWHSLLGHDFPLDEIERDEKKNLAELGRIRRMPVDNQYCADCGDHNTSWASVNLGVFLCMPCGIHHRHMGTHISKTKGCMGSFIWGPDEIAQMKTVGNARARLIYGGDAQRPDKATATDDDWFRYIVDKYEHKKFKPHHHSPTNHIMTPRTPTSMKKDRVDWEHFADESSPPVVLRPAHHLSPTKFVEKKHHPKTHHPVAIHLEDSTTSTNPEEFFRDESRQDTLSPSTSTHKDKVNQKDFFASFGL